MNTKLAELNKDVAELNQLHGIAQRPKVKDILLIEMRKLETEISRLRELEAVPTEDSCKSPTTPTANNSFNKCYNVNLTNYAWYQSGKFVKILVDLPGVQELPSEKVSCEFSSSEATLSVNELNNRNYTLTIKNLFLPIEPSLSLWKVKTDKVMILMCKREENVQWTSLDCSVKDAEKKVPDMDTEGDASAGLMKLIKRMYEEGDDDMKRTIAEAWTVGSKQKNMNSSA